MIRRQPGVARSIRALVNREALPSLQQTTEQLVKSSVQSY